MCVGSVRFAESHRASASVSAVHGRTHVAVDDTTIYGTSRSSPRSFYGHHAAAVSAAIVFAESAVIRATACTLADELMVLRPPAPRAA